jgi:hypothetical protein
MDKWVVGYLWMLSLLGALFLGNEIGMMKHEYIDMKSNAKLQNCNKIIADIKE